MDFWNTVMGHQLADVLIRFLPVIAEKSCEETEQKATVLMKGGADTEKLLDAINNGEERFIGTFTSPEGATIVITEKKRR